MMIKIRTLSVQRPGRWQCHRKEALLVPKEGDCIFVPIGVRWSGVGRTYRRLKGYDCRLD